MIFFSLEMFCSEFVRHNTYPTLIRYDKKFTRLTNIGYALSRMNLETKNLMKELLYIYTRTLDKTILMEELLCVYIYIVQGIDRNYK